MTVMSVINLFWSSVKGKFVNKLTGQALVLSTSLSIGPTFSGSTNEWNECLVETLVDATNMTKTRGTVTLRVSKATRSLLETTVLFKHDADGGFIKGSRNMLLRDRDGQKDEIISIVNSDGETVATVTVLDIGKKK